MRPSISLVELTAFFEYLEKFEPEKLKEFVALHARKLSGTVKTIAGKNFIDTFSIEKISLSELLKKHGMSVIHRKESGYLEGTDYFFTNVPALDTLLTVLFFFSFEAGKDERTGIQASDISLTLRVPFPEEFFEVFKKTTTSLLELLSVTLDLDNGTLKLIFPKLLLRYPHAHRLHIPKFYCLGRQVNLFIPHPEIEEIVRLFYMENCHVPRNAMQEKDLSEMVPCGELRRMNIVWDPAGAGYSTIKYLKTQDADKIRVLGLVSDGRDIAPLVISTRDFLGKKCTVNRISEVLESDLAFLADAFDMKTPGSLTIYSFEPAIVPKHISMLKDWSIKYIPLAEAQFNLEAAASPVNIFLIRDNSPGDIHLMNRVHFELTGTGTLNFIQPVTVSDEIRMNENKNSEPLKRLPVTEIIMALSLGQKKLMCLNCRDSIKHSSDSSWLDWE